ncbi:MAG: choice-of-anchor D domain-containing protein [Planctomycetota bacterium]|jgi:hypothetical protein
MRAAVLLTALGVGCASGGVDPPPPIQAVVNLDLVRADAPTVRGVTIANPLPGEAAVELVGEAAGPIVPAAGALPGVVAGEGDFTLQVRVTPEAPGELEGELTLQFVGAAGEGARQVVLSLSATVEETTVELVTAAVDFGDVRIGETSTRAVRVRNPNRLTPIRITDVSSLPAEFTRLGTALPATVAPGQALALSVRYTPQQLGDKSFDFSITHSEGPAPLVATLTAATTTWAPEIITDFGNVTVAGGETEWLEVAVPAHAISLSLEAVGPDRAVLGLRGLEGPGGRVYENAQLTGALLWTPGFGVFTATVPNSDRDEVQLVSGGGTYRFRLFLLSGSAGTLAVRAIVHNRPGGLVVDGVLSLNVFLASGLGATPGDTRLQEILDETDRIFAQQGLRLGAVSYFDLEDSAFDDVTEDEFEALLEESAAAPETRMNLFFVRTALGGGVLGVAARIAGPQLNGTQVSGVMVDYDFGSSATAGYVTAHEIGHYLGLFHTVEQSGDHDIIDDTLECPASGTDAQCPTPGGDYLMHWQVLSADPVISDGQGRVVLGHPLVAPPGFLQALALRALPALSGPLDPLPDGWCGTPAGHPKH